MAVEREEGTQSDGSETAAENQASSEGGSAEQAEVAENAAGAE